MTFAPWLTLQAKVNELGLNIAGVAKNKHYRESDAWLKQIRSNCFNLIYWTLSRCPSPSLPPLHCRCADNGLYRVHLCNIFNLYLSFCFLAGHRKGRHAKNVSGSSNIIQSPCHFFFFCLLGLDRERNKCWYCFIVNISGWQWPRIA